MTTSDNHAEWDHLAIRIVEMVDEWSTERIADVIQLVDSLTDEEKQFTVVALARLANELRATLGLSFEAMYRKRPPS